MNLFEMINRCEIFISGGVVFTEDQIVELTLKFANGKYEELKEEPIAQAKIGRNALYGTRRQPAKALWGPRRKLCERTFESEKKVLRALLLHNIPGRSKRLEIRSPALAKAITNRYKLLRRIVAIPRIDKEARVFLVFEIPEFKYLIALGSSLISDSSRPWRTRVGQCAGCKVIYLNEERGRKRRRCLTCAKAAEKDRSALYLSEWRKQKRGADLSA